MIIDFEKLPIKTFPHFYDGKKEMNAQLFMDDANRIMLVTLEQGASVGSHHHDEQSEIIYILEGRATIVFNDETEYLTKGQCHYCPKGNTHSIANEDQSDLVFFAVAPTQ